MQFFNLFKINRSERHQFCTEIIDSSAPTGDYYFLLVLSTLIVAMGLLADNVILVIGGMMVTPLLSPILAIALSITILNARVIFRSIRVFVVSFFFAFLIAAIAGLISDRNISEIELIKIMEPSFFTFVIATIAGLAASFTWAKPEHNSRLPGIAVTVTLIPPLTALGLAIADREVMIFYDVLKVLLLNLSGIILASLLVFFFMEFYRAEKKIIAEVKEEEKELSK